jgi:transcriptional regulator with XRE-family HTH domain
MGNRRGEPSGFGTTLKRLREEAGLSQGELAEKAGLNLWGVAKLEQGVREPTWNTVLVLAAALGVDCTAFAGDDGKPGKAKGKK